MENKKNWYEIKALAEKLEVHILDEIGGWGIDVSTLILELSQYKGRALSLLINSPGGNLFDAVALYNFLKINFPVISTECLGLAASAASILFLAGSERTMHQGTFLMIHNPWGGIAGDAEEMRKYAELLDAVTAEMVKIYTANSSLTEDDIKTKMSAETWINATEALNYGMATNVTETKVAACISDPTKFKNAPKALIVNQETKPEVQEVSVKNEVTNLNIEAELSTPSKEITMDKDVVTPVAVGIDVQASIVQPVVDSGFNMSRANGREFLNVLTTASGPVTQEIGGLVEGLKEANPLRGLVEVINVQGELAYAYSAAGVGGGWGNESGAITETAVTMEPVVFGAYTLRGRYDVSDAALEDNAKVLYQNLKSSVTKFFASEEAKKMFGKQTGASGIQGLFDTTDVDTLETAGANIALADVVAFLDGLDTKFGNVTLIMSPSVFSKVVQLKDATGQLDIDRTNKLIQGIPYIRHSDAPAYSSTAGSPLILAANLDEYYKIVQRGNGANAVKIKEVAAPDDFATRVLYAERLDAKIVNPSAGKILTIKSA